MDESCGDVPVHVVNKSAVWSDVIESRTHQVRWMWYERVCGARVECVVICVWLYKLADSPGQGTGVTPNARRMYSESYAFDAASRTFGCRAIPWRMRRTAD